MNQQLNNIASGNYCITMTFCTRKISAAKESLSVMVVRHALKATLMALFICSSDTKSVKEQSDDYKYLIQERMALYILRLLSVSSTKFSNILMASKVTVN